jgi:hypothetical protein
MDVLQKRITISLLLMTTMVSVFANPNKNEREAARVTVEQHNSQHLNQDQYGRPQNNGQTVRNDNQPADGSRKQGKLTPEERRALRRQINEAGHDIYSSKP